MVHISHKTICEAVAAYELAAGHYIAPGQTISTNHDGCTAGLDTRQRLYITRKRTDTGRTTDLAYCHNCGIGGTSRPTEPANFRIPGAPPTPTKGSNDLHLPMNLVPPGTADFPAEATAFLGHALPPAFINASVGVGYDRQTSRLILPIYNHIWGQGGLPDNWGSLLGWQARRLYGDGPKYLTVESDAAAAGDGLAMELDLWRTSPASDVVILVEDWLSAVYVASGCPQATVIPLLRYKIAAERLAGLRKRFKYLCVWLDDDKPEVIDTRDYIKKLWAAMGGDAGHSGGTIDPKHWRTVELENHYTIARRTRGLPVYKV